MQDETKKLALPMFVQSAQLLVLIIGVGVMMMSIGKRNAELDSALSQTQELKSITSDLTKAVSTLAVTDALQTQLLRSIEQRIFSLEGKK